MPYGPTAFSNILRLLACGNFDISAKMISQLFSYSSGQYDIIWFYLLLL